MSTAALYNLTHIFIIYIMPLIMDLHWFIYILSIAAHSIILHCMYWFRFVLLSTCCYCFCSVVWMSHLVSLSDGFCFPHVYVSMDVSNFVSPVSLFYVS